MTQLFRSGREVIPILRLFLSDGVVELDGKMPFEEKKRELERIISEHPDEFTYFVPDKKETKYEQQAMDLIEYRLHVLGSWLLQGEQQDKEYSVMSAYAEKRNKKTQLSYETLMDKLQGKEDVL